MSTNQYGQWMNNKSPAILRQGSKYLANLLMTLTKYLSKVD